MHYFIFCMFACVYTRTYCVLGKFAYVNTNAYLCINRYFDYACTCLTCKHLCMHAQAHTHTKTFPQKYMSQHIFFILCKKNIFIESQKAVQEIWIEY